LEGKQRGLKRIGRKTKRIEGKQRGLKRIEGKQRGLNRVEKGWKENKRT
jgi:hypothetical protein